jgi:hypothetical protein
MIPLPQKSLSKQGILMLSCRVYLSIFSKVFPLSLLLSMLWSWLLDSSMGKKAYNIKPLSNGKIHMDVSVIGYSVVMELLHMTILAALLLWVMYQISHKTVDIVECLNHYARRFLALISGSFLYMAAVYVGMILFMVPGVYFAIAFLPFLPIVFSEDCTGIEALKRSRELTKGHWWFCLFLFFNPMLFFALIFILACQIFFGVNASVASIIENIFVQVGIIALMLPYFCTLMVLMLHQLKLRRRFKVSAEATAKAS